MTTFNVINAELFKNVSGVFCPFCENLQQDFLSGVQSFVCKPFFGWLEMQYACLECISFLMNRIMIFFLRLKNSTTNRAKVDVLVAGIKLCINKV